MNLFAGAPVWLAWILVILLVAAAVQDAVQLKISNLLVVGVFAAALVAATHAGLDTRMVQNVAVFAIVLAIGTFLFARGMLGGGDVKLFAAVAAWADFRTAFALVSAILLCGGVLALAILLCRMLAPAAVQGRAAILKRGGGIPYGVAVTAGSLIIVALSRAGYGA